MVEVVDKMKKKSVKAANLNIFPFTVVRDLVYWGNILVIGEKLDCMILEVFSNLDSMYIINHEPFE